MIGTSWRQALVVRLSAAFLILSIGALGIAALVSYRSAESALRERHLELLLAFAEEDASELTAWLDRHRNFVRFLAATRSSDEAARGDTARLGVVIRGLDVSVFSADEVEVLSVPGGRVIFSTLPGRVGEYRVSQLYYLEGRARTFTQPIYPSARDGRPSLTVSTPIVGADSTVRAVLAAHLDLQEMERVIRKRPSEVPVDAYLISPFAEFVSAERFGRADRNRGVHSVAIDSVLTRTNGAGLYRDHAGQAVVGAWRWLPDHQLGLVIESPRDLALAPARALLLRSMLVGLLASLLLLLGVLSITRRLTRPLTAMARAADRVAAGDFTAIVPVQREDEVGLLAAAFNTMTGNLRTAYGELADQVVATRLALREAQTSRALLQDVVDNTPTLVLAVDDNGGIRLANARLAVVLGLPPERIAGALLSELPGTLPAALASLIREARARDAAIGREIEVGTEGALHTWQSVAFPLRDPSGGRYAMGVVATDLTERARLEEDRRTRDASVQQAQKLESLGIMAGGIAHDFNNLLGAIQGNVDLAQSAPDDPEEVRGALEQIATATKRASELARQMLAYAGRASLRREVLDIRGVLRDILPLVRASQPKRVEFVVDAMDQPLWVEADPAQISQVALNLLTNAAEAIGDAPGRVRLHAALVATAPIEAHESESAHLGPWIRISVEDSGAGVSPEVQARMFDPFFTTKSAGRGLGLSAVRGIIGSTGGVLRLTSTPGQGARFDVYLPAAPAPHGAPRSPRPTSVEFVRNSILVVDDEDMLRRVMCRTLESAGFTIISAADGDEGLRRYKDHRASIALLVLDITMPGLNGIELLAEIRRLTPGIPAIIASGYDRPDELASTLNVPHTRFLQKPFSLQALRDAASELLAEVTP